MTNYVVKSGDSFVNRKGGGLSDKFWTETVPTFETMLDAKRHYGSLWDSGWTIEPAPLFGRGAETETDAVDKTLDERGKRYGSFERNAAISQAIKRTMRGAVGWHSLSEDQQEALDMIACKISRILTGDPNYADNWHDIAGYATLVEKRLNGDS